jgi:hypothetical protein
VDLSYETGISIPVGLWDSSIDLGLAEYIDRILRGVGFDRVIEKKVQDQQVE